MCERTQHGRERSPTAGVALEWSTPVPLGAAAPRAAHPRGVVEARGAAGRTLEPPRPQQSDATAAKTSASCATEATPFAGSLQRAEGYHLVATGAPAPSPSSPTGAVRKARAGVTRHIPPAGGGRMRCSAMLTGLVVSGAIVAGRSHDRARSGRKPFTGRIPCCRRSVCECSAC